MIAMTMAKKKKNEMRGTLVLKVYPCYAHVKQIDLLNFHFYTNAPLLREKSDQILKRITEVILSKQFILEKNVIN